MIDTQATGKMRIVWLGMFAMACIKHKQNTDVIFVLEKLGKAFTTAAV